MSVEFTTEASLCAAAGAAGRAWRERGLGRLLVGLSGDLGTGKTTWVRALLEGLGHRGRVPSPTYTLLEHYEIGALTIVHLDLYRLSSPRELEFLGIRDWLGLAEVWLFAEWPERGGEFAAALDLELAFGIGADEARTMAVSALTGTGREAQSAWFEADFNYSV